MITTMQLAACVETHNRHTCSAPGLQLLCKAALQRCWQRDVIMFALDMHLSVIHACRGCHQAASKANTELPGKVQQPRVHCSPHLSMQPQLCMLYRAAPQKSTTYIHLHTQGSHAQHRMLHNDTLITSDSKQAQGASVVWKQGRYPYNNRPILAGCQGGTRRSPTLR